MENTDIELDYNTLFLVYQKKVNNLTNQNILLEAKLLTCTSKIEELQNQLLANEKKEVKSNSKSKSNESESTF